MIISSFLSIPVSSIVYKVLIFFTFMSLPWLTYTGGQICGNELNVETEKVRSEHKDRDSKENRQGQRYSTQGGRSYVPF